MLGIVLEVRGDPLVVGFVLIPRGGPGLVTRRQQLP